MQGVPSRHRPCQALYENNAFKIIKLTRPAPTDPYSSSQGIQSLPYFLAISQNVSTPAAPETM